MCQISCNPPSCCTPSGRRRYQPIAEETPHPRANSCKLTENSKLALSALSVGAGVCICPGIGVYGLLIASEYLKFAPVQLFGVIPALFCCLMAYYNIATTLDCVETSKSVFDA